MQTNLLDWDEEGHIIYKKFNSIAINADIVTVVQNVFEPVIKDVDDPTQFVASGSKIFVTKIN